MTAQQKETIAALAVLTPGHWWTSHPGCGIEFGTGYRSVLVTPDGRVHPVRS